jgi:hypothetical protein
MLPEGAGVKGPLAHKRKFQRHPHASRRRLEGKPPPDAGIRATANRELENFRAFVSATISKTCKRGGTSNDRLPNDHLPR